MSDRGRDLKVAILSDADRFDLAKPADQLDTLATAATRADRALDQLDIQDAARDLDRFGDEAKETARRVDAAFDAIARSSRASTRQVADDSGSIRRKLRDIGDEAKDTARETAASLSNFADDLTGGAQELAANAGALFGPVGLAIGAALSGGIAIFQQRAEEMRAQAEEILGQLLESGGRVTKAMVEQRLQAMKLQILETSDEAARAKVNIDDYNLALAGDPEAIKRTTAAIAARYEAIGKAGDAAMKAGALPRYLLDEDAALKVLEGRLGTNAAAADRAAAALARLEGASARAADQADADAGRYAAAGAKLGQGYATSIAEATDSVSGAARRVADAAAAELSRPIVAKLDLDTTAFYRALAQARAAAKYAAAERVMP